MAGSSVPANESGGMKSLPHNDREKRATYLFCQTLTQAKLRNENILSTKDADATEREVCEAVKQRFYGEDVSEVPVKSGR